MPLRSIDEDRNLMVLSRYFWRYSKAKQYKKICNMQAKMTRRATTKFCTVCQHDVCAPSKSIMLECGHLFHWKCLLDSIYMCDRKCPLCQESISTADMIRICMISRVRKSKKYMIVDSQYGEFVLVPHD